VLRPDQIAQRPEDVGIEPARLAALFARAERDVVDGTLPSAQVAVARHGQLAGVRTFGRARQGGADAPATDATLYSVFSVTKAAIAVSIWQLLEAGKLRLEERVADVIPEFGTNGKDVITVEQLILLIGGFPYAPFHPDHWSDRQQRLAAFRKWRLNWEPGSRYEYHPTAAHWVLAEIIERRSDEDYRAYVRAHVTGPMGLDEFFLGLPPEQDHRVADVCYVGQLTEPPGGWKDVTPDAILQLNRPELRRIGIPGGGAVTSAAELALFYQTLLNGGVTPDGTRILEAATIDDATRVRTQDRHRDPLLDIPVNRALGVVVAGGDGRAHLRGFGHAVSPRAFGHGGAGGQVAWGDPVTGISVGYCTNGFVDWLTAGRRTTAISTLAAQCVAG